MGITDTSGIRFSSIIIAYPLPHYVLEYEDGTYNDGMTDTLTWNSINNFTISFNKSDAKQRDYGLYHLRLSNVFGNTVIYVNVFPQSKKVEFCKEIFHLSLRMLEEVFERIYHAVSNMLMPVYSFNLL